MIVEMEEIQVHLDALVTALDGHDPAAIISATESLATVVILFQGSSIPHTQQAQARVLIERTMRKLESAAIRVNVLRDWTRQRIDRNREFRGTQTGGIALSY